MEAKARGRKEFLKRGRYPKPRGKTKMFDEKLDGENEKEMCSERPDKWYNKKEML